MISPEWYQSLAKLVTYIGDDAFCERLAECCQTLTGYDSTVIIAFMTNQKPRLLFSNLSERDEAPTLGHYFDGAYLLDPLYILYREQAPDGIYRLKEVAPEEFFDTEYYRSYFQNTRIIDETGMLVKISPDIHLVISFGLREGSVPREFLIRELRTIFPLLSAACLQHWSRENQLSPLLSDCSTSGEFGTTLDAAFSNFAKDYLTQRECEIVHLILKGYSSKSIAQLLDISVDTVKVHRKRFHAKLNVSSQAELFSLFLESISMVPLGSDEDPLNYYYQSQEINPPTEN